METSIEVSPTPSPVTPHAPEDDQQRAEWGLHQYTCEVAAGLGIGPEALCCEVAGQAIAYIALDERLPGLPDRDAALVWDSRNGWAIGIEYGTGANVLTLAYLGPSLLPEPQAVVVFVKQMLAGHSTGPFEPPERAGRDILRRLVEFAPTAAVP